jgi:hypothetical protein
MQAAVAVIPGTMTGVSGAEDNETALLGPMLGKLPTDGGKLLDRDSLRGGKRI